MYVIEIDYEDGRTEYGSTFASELTALESLAETVGELKREDGASVFQLPNESDWYVSLPGEVGSSRYRIVRR